MGGSQSSRKIGIDNDEVVGVIQVSESVANRLKNVNNNGGNNPHTFSNPQQHQSSINHPNPAYQQPSGGIYMQQPFITSSMIRGEIEKELEKNDRYWEKRIKSLQENQNRLSHIMEAEFDKAYKEIERNFPTIAPKNAVMPCQDYKSVVVDCLKNNSNHTLNCNKVVSEFTSCISNSRSKHRSETRSP